VHLSSSWCNSGAITAIRYWKVHDWSVGIRTFSRRLEVYHYLDSSQSVCHLDFRVARAQSFFYRGIDFSVQCSMKEGQCFEILVTLFCNLQEDLKKLQLEKSIRKCRKLSLDKTDPNSFMWPLVLRHRCSGSMLLAKVEKDLNSFQFVFARKR